MKNKNLIKGTIIFSAFALVAIGALSVQAASEDDLFKSFRRGEGGINIEARQVRAYQGEGFNYQNLTEEEKLEFDQERELRRAEGDMRREEMQGNRELIHEAIENGDYETWKELAPDNCPMAEGITEENFSGLKDRIGQREAGARRQNGGFEGRGMHRMMLNR